MPSVPEQIEALLDSSSPEVIHRFMHWLLVDPEQGVMRYASDAERPAIEAVAYLHVRVINGDVVLAKEWAAARAAARAAAWDAAWDAAWAAAWDAAWAAARDAARDAAWDAAWAAARAAARDAAWAAARAAARDAAWAAARDAAWAAQLTKLQELQADFMPTNEAAA